MASILVHNEDADQANEDQLWKARVCQIIIQGHDVGIAHVFAWPKIADIIVFILGPGS